MKKVFAMFFAALLVLSGVNGASKKKENPYKKIKAEKNPETKKKYNFDGMSVIIGDWYSDPTRKAASKAEEDLRSWHEWSNTTYNMNVVQKSVAGWSSNPQFVSNFCITGGEENYVFIIDGRSAIKGVRADLYYDLSKIKSVDYKNPERYDQGVTIKLAKGDSFYAFNWEKPEPKNGMFFNKRVLQENGYDPDYPYDLQKEGKWTWDTFEEMCKKMTKDTDNDGIIDQYAMSSFNTEFAYICLDSNGGSLIGRDANGKYFNNAGSEKSMEAWHWMAHMWANYQLPQTDGASWDYFYTAFMNGETAFLADHQYNALTGGRFENMADDFGFVCFPLGPSGDQVYRTIHDSKMAVIPSCYDDERAEKIAKAVDLYLLPAPGYDGPDAWKETYYPGFRDSRAVDETLELMAATPNPRFDTLITGLSQGDMIFGVLGGYQTPEEAYEECKNRWQSLINDCNR